MRTEREKMLEGDLYDPMDLELVVRVSGLETSARR